MPASETILATVLLTVLGLGASIAVAMMISHLRGWRAATYDECPKCGYDLRASAGRCPECGHQIAKTDNPRYRLFTLPVPETPIAPRKPDADETLVRVFEHDSEGFAHTVQEHLNARGFATVLREAKAGSVYGPMYSYQVFVYQHDEHAARDLVTFLTEPVDEPAD